MSRIELSVRKIILHKSHIERLTAKKIAADVGVSVSSVYYTLRRWREDTSVSDRVQKNRRSGPGDVQLEKKVIKSIINNRSVSIRTLATRHGTSDGTIRAIKARNNLKTYKKKLVPKRSPEQKERARLRTGRLYRKIVKEKNTCIVMDDETYVYFDTSLLLSTQFYTARPGEDLHPKITTMPKCKFEKKGMIWQAICTCGRRSGVFVCKGTMDADIYQRECIKKRLVPFLRSHTNPTLFWPDLASCHYARSTIQLMDQYGVNFVPKELNPPNSPGVRPIENFWALMKRKMQRFKRSAPNVGKGKLEHRR